MILGISLITCLLRFQLCTFLNYKAFIFSCGFIIYKFESFALKSQALLAVDILHQLQVGL